MENRTLEITLQDAKDLNNVNLFTKMDVYAVVSISGGDKNSKQRTKTPVDHDGDANPTWNFPMKFKVDETALHQNRLTLDFKLICERALGDKEVGEVNVSIKELFDSPAYGGGADGKQFVSYQVRKPSGKPKGHITFSYKFIGKPADAAAALSPAAGFYGASTVAYPTVEHYPAYSPVWQGGYTPPPPYHVVAAVEGGGHYPPTAPPMPPQAPPYHVMAVEEGVEYYPSPSCYPAAGVYPPPPPPAGYGYPPPQPGYHYPSRTLPGYGYSPPPPPQGYGFPPPHPTPMYGYAPAQPDYGFPRAAA